MRSKLTPAWQGVVSAPSNWLDGQSCLVRGLTLRLLTQGDSLTLGFAVCHLCSFCHVAAAACVSSNELDDTVC